MFYGRQDQIFIIIMTGKVARTICSVQGIDYSMPFLVGETVDMYKKYLGVINEFINIILKLNGANEAQRITLSDERLAKDRFVPRTAHKFKKGEVYQFEFGRNYFPEMSFEHRGLIIGIRGKLLYVLPICSYNRDEESHRNAYHPIENPDKKQDYYLLKSSEFSFIKHDSVLKLSDLRSISVNRKLYSHFGKMDINGNCYKEIEHLVLQKYFQDFSFAFDKLQVNHAELQEELKAVNAQKEELEIQIQKYISQQTFGDEQNGGLTPQKSDA